MPRRSHSAAEKLSPESAVESQEKALTDLALTARRGVSAIPPKVLAYELGIGVRRVTSWKSGEVPIPEDRELQIVGVALQWGLEQLPMVMKCAQILKDEIERIYGPRRGHASREVF